MTIPKPSALLAGCVRPPFKGLVLLVWGFFVWCFLLHPQSPILNGHFYDSDDYTYLTHILDWLKGQSWLDTIQHRMNPPEGVPIHFSRVTELPLAGLILFWHWIGFDWVPAATVAAACWPLILFAVFLGVLRWLGESFLPRDWTRATSFVALFATALTFQFSPGRVDHHGLAPIVTALAFGSTLRLFAKPNHLKWAFGAGLFLSLGQVIALETLPWFLMLSGLIGLWMMFKGREAAFAGFVFGLTLLGTSAAFLMLTKDPETWADPDLVAFSITFVELAAGIAFCCACVALASLVRFPPIRILTGLAVAALAGGYYFTLYPELLAGPYGGANQNLVALFFENIHEALPLAQLASSNLDLLVKLLFPMLGLASCAFFMLRARDEREIVPWTFNSLLLLAATLLAVFYQARFSTYMMLFSIVPLTAFLRLSLNWADAQYRGQKLANFRLLFILLVGPLPMVFLPAIIDGRPFNTGVLLFPATTSGDQNCWDDPLYQLLNLPPYNDGKPRLIMNALDQGAELLFRTPHQVIAAPYHTNADGVLDSLAFFASTDEAESEQILRARGADLVVLCRETPDMYLKDPRAKETATPSPDQQDQGKPALPTMAKRLIDGQDPPWLKRVQNPLIKNMLLFEVVPKAPEPQTGDAQPPTPDAPDAPAAATDMPTPPADQQTPANAPPVDQSISADGQPQNPQTPINTPATPPPPATNTVPAANAPPAAPQSMPIAAPSSVSVPVTITPTPPANAPTTAPPPAAKAPATTLPPAQSLPQEPKKPHAETQPIETFGQVIQADDLLPHDDDQQLQQASSAKDPKEKEKRKPLVTPEDSDGIKLP